MYQRIGAAAYKTDIENTVKLCNLLYNPQNSFKCIHVAGTNGKGSVSHALAAVFQANGYKTGLYTSPHLVDFRERIRINGKKISKNFVCGFINKYKIEIEEINPSFFEVTVALAFNYFAKKDIDIAIIETGLGGRLDSTNIITPELSVITNISFDHTALLGNTLEKIAKEKAGIIKKNTPVVIGETQNQIADIFKEKAMENSSEIFFADKNINFKNLKISSDLKGDYQKKNMNTVWQCIEILKQKGYKLNDSKNIYAIKNIKKLTGLRGRWEIISKKPLTICDTAHNEAGLRLVINQLLKMEFDKLHIVFGVVNDKETFKYWGFLPKNAIYYFCKPEIPRGRDSHSLYDEAKRNGIIGKTFENTVNAANHAIEVAGKNDVIFIGGSTFTVADYLCFHEKKK
ncbi:MAG: bifunctional folylpolyglutamate synthase/dihydrofolate synthase [Bacteroidetes bacterium]|nr:bifunctional folylpolyglutamate synthase/dihydrofolate synthase [Bacteroidota bacterium]